MIKTNIEMNISGCEEEVWNIITNNQDYSWRSDLSNLRVVDEAHFIEYDKTNFPTYFKIVTKNKLDKYILHFENKNLQGSFVGTIQKKDNNSVLILTEEVEVKNIIMKLLAKSYLKKQQARYINDLKIKLEKNSSKL